VSVSDLRFLAGMGEKLGYYVYALTDPDGGQPINLRTVVSTESEATASSGRNLKRATGC
jgi:hypothetical protein